MRLKSAAMVLGSWFGALVRDERGATAVYVGAAIAVLVGVGGLAIDLGRLVTVNTQLQKFADAAALAGAAELNRKSGAQARAAAAANGAFAQNRQTFATGNADIAISSIVFYTSLDSPSAGTDLLASGDVDSLYIEVTTELRSVPSYLIVAVGGAATTNTQARAVAGYTQAVCKVPPLFICNPDETPANPGAPFNSAAWKGKQILMKAQASTGNTQQGSGSGAAWAPGDFGLLQPPGGHASNKAISQQLGSTTPLGCYASTIDLAPGQKSASMGLNVRFDMYQQAFQSEKNNPEYRPSASVIKGLKPQGNQWVSDDPNYVKLQRDTCFATSTCSGSNRFGTGQWDFQAYWNANHRDAAGNPLPVPAALNYSTTPNPDTGLNVPTRYQVYRYEVDNNAVPRPPTPPANPLPRSLGEDGRPKNYKNGNFTSAELVSCPAIPDASNTNCDTPEEVLANFDRRVLLMAVVNCVENEALLGGAQTGIPAESWAMFFLTEPMQDDTGNSNKEIWGEVIGGMDMGNTLYKEIVKDMVQLYR